MNYIFYHITSASLSWNPFIQFLHTIRIIPPPDIVTGWHILCLIYFLCTIQALIKQEQRSPHSWCHYTNFQKGAAPHSSSLHRDHRALSLARGRGTLPPIFGFLDAFRVNDYLLHPRQHSLTTCDHLLSVPTQSLNKWNIIIFYILNRPPTALLGVPYKDCYAYLGVSMIDILHPSSPVVERPPHPHKNCSLTDKTHS